MTCYAYDFEFHEDGHSIDPISVAIVCEDGREYYAVFADADWDRIRQHDWLCKHVVPHLPLNGKIEKSGFGSNSAAVFSLDHSDARVKPRRVIANEVREFLLATGEPELWADYGAYDHVALAQLYGRMIRLPKGLPMFTRDLQQELAHRPEATVPEQQAGTHNALEDARHLMACLRHLSIAEPAPDLEQMYRLQALINRIVERHRSGTDAQEEGPAIPQRGQLWLYAYPGGGIDVVWIYEAASSTGDPQAIDGLGAYGPLETLTQGGRPVKKLADARDHPVNGTEGTAR